MELVYLWVEEYKNIHNQGFNFSPRFKCSYDGAANELTIDKNEEHLSIFPKNINVTAIVGENGSGKSSILNISYLSSMEEVSLKKKYFCVFIKNDELYIDRNFEFIFSKKFQNSKISFLNEKEDGILPFDQKYIDLIQKYELYKKNSNFHTLSFMYNPTKIKISEIDIDNKLLKKINPKFSKSFEWDFPELSSEIQPLISKLENLLHDLKIALSECRCESEELSNFILKFDQNQLLQESKIKEYYYECLLEKNKYLLIDETNIDQINSLKLDYYDIDFRDENDVDFSSLSDGEKRYSLNLLKSHEEISHSDEDNIIYGFDEPDNFLHPDWQKRFIRDLLKVFENSEKKVHFIITSHSPFILSDIPKENVIFLKKDEKTGNCKNVTKETNINTFGANIHTLLSHGFFMKDGLMGEFAKEKINEVIKLLRSKRKVSHKNLKLCENIISIIGEPVLQKTLQNMLNEKKLSHLTKLEKLKIQQKEIKDQIKVLEENQ